jgi:hypothetical protein
MRRRHSRAVVTASAALAIVTLAIGCSTLADSGGGGTALPNARAGPFRLIRQPELGNTRAAPYALRDNDDFPRDATVIDRDGDPATLEVLAYAAHVAPIEDVDPDPTQPPDEIVRFVALDARSMPRTFDIVLTVDRDWEGGTVGAPAALFVESEVWLYYHGAGGIGLAKSPDGLTFGKQGEGPVFSASSDGWDAGAVPRSPAVVRLPDGRFQLFYEVELSPGVSAIGEAVSQDGVSFERVGVEPLIAPRGPSGDPLLPHGDAVSAGAPCSVFALTPEGRLIQYLYYGGRDDTGKATILMAARHGTEGPMSRAVAPVFATTLSPTEPWVLRYDGFTLLFATQEAGSTAALAYPAVAVGVAPADSTLPPPNPP